MNDLDRTEILRKLDQRHDQLLEEIDSLDERIDQALTLFAKPSATAEIL